VFVRHKFGGAQTLSPELSAKQQSFAQSLLDAQSAAQTFSKHSTPPQHECAEQSSPAPTQAGSSGAGHTLLGAQTDWPVLSLKQHALRQSAFALQSAAQMFCTHSAPSQHASFVAQLPPGCTHADDAPFAPAFAAPARPPGLLPPAPAADFVPEPPPALARVPDAPAPAAPIRKLVFFPADEDPAEDGCVIAPALPDAALLRPFDGRTSELFNLTQTFERHERPALQVALAQHAQPSSPGTHTLALGAQLVAIHT
jgi:hypothetical protein